MGAVFLARDVALERPVAIKLLLPHNAHDAALRERFLREAQTAAQLMHPNIVPIHAVEARDDLVYFVMAYVDGETLTEKVARDGPLKAGDALRITREVAWALGYAHGRGVIHRDIKPDNILVEHASGRALVADFGIARVERRDTLTADGAFVGTIQYMSPEQASADPVDGRTDVYSLGATMYYALTGTAPVNGPTLPAMLNQLMTAEPESVALVRQDLSSGFGGIVMRALAKDRAARFDSADAMAGALQDVDRAEPAVRPEVRSYLGQVGQAKVLLAMAILGVIGGALLWLGGVVAPDVAGAVIGVSAVGAFVFGFVAPVGALIPLQRQGISITEVVNGIRVQLREMEEAVERLRSPSVIRQGARAVGWLLVALGGLFAVFGFGVAIKGHTFRAPVLFIFAAAVAYTVGGVTLLRASKSPNPVNAFTKWFLGSGKRRPTGDWLLRGVAWFLQRRFVRRLFDPVLQARPTTISQGAPTATLLLQRIEDLIAQLPPDARARLGDAIPVASSLERANITLRKRLETIDSAIAELPMDSPVRTEFAQARERTAARLADCVRALEQLRTDLLRLSAGLLASDGLSLALEMAGELSASIDAELHGADEVRKLL